MIYKLLRFVFRITNRFYFKNIRVRGIEHIPSEGPVFLVANHPSAFMDPIVIGTITGRPLFFLAKGILFQNRFTRWLLPKFNMIPIFRSNETPGLMHKNKEIFSHCSRHFEKGEAILAFPEGISLTERKLKKIQTGTARICLGAEAENNFGLGVKIIPVGLNYSDPHQFQSDLLVNIGEPITVADYQELYKTDAFRAAHTLTDVIRERLEALIVAIEDEAVDKLVSDIELLYKAQLLQDPDATENEMERDFNTTKAIRDSIYYFNDIDPLRVQKLSNDIGQYLKDLEQFSLSDAQIKKTGSSSLLLDSIKSLFYLALGFPLFAFGFTNNYLPFKIPSWTARFISKRPEFFGSIVFSLGTLSFLSFYFIQTWLMNTWTNSWQITLCYLLLLPVSGLFAFYYGRRVSGIRDSWKVMSLFYRKSRWMSSLILKRQNIIHELEKGKEEFLQRNTHPGSGGSSGNTEELNSFFNLYEYRTLIPDL